MTEKQTRRRIWSLVLQMGVLPQVEVPDGGDSLLQVVVVATTTLLCGVDVGAGSRGHDLLWELHSVLLTNRHAGTIGGSGDTVAVRK